MIVTKGNPSIFETRLFTSIKDLTAKNIKFEKVCFMVESITDADGRLFVRKSDDKNRWFDLFGTPERAAQTLNGICERCKYGDCATCGVPEWADYSHDYDALLEWLRSDA